MTYSFKTAVVGAGPVGCATIAHLIAGGQECAIWSPTGRHLNREAETGKARYAVRGNINRVITVDWLPGLDALSDYDVVLICLPANSYRDVLPRLISHLRDDQVVLISGALSLVPIWLSEEAEEQGHRPSIGGWSTTATTAHFNGDGSLHLNELRSTIGVSSVHPEQLPLLLQVSRTLLGDRFTPELSPLASSLANINPIAHAAEVIPNLDRIGRGERWPLFGCFGPEVARLAQRLDDERLAIAAHFGFTLRSLTQHYHESYHVPLGSLDEMAASIEAAGKGPWGPTTLEHRYILEDMPFGLAFQERLARLAHVPCPMHSSALDLLETVCGVKLRAQNYLLDSLLGDPETASKLLTRLSAAA